MNFNKLITNASVENYEEIFKFSNTTNNNRIVNILDYNTICNLYGEENVKGNPYGNQGEKEDFLKWVLNTKYLLYAESLFFTAVVNYGKDITTQFLKNISGTHGRRILSLRNKIDYKLLDMNYYYREYIIKNFTTKKHEFGEDARGNLRDNGDTIQVGGFSRRNRLRTFKKLVSKEVYDEHIKKVNEIKERDNQRSMDTKYFREVALNNLILLNEGKEGRNVNRELTNKEFDAGWKLNHKDTKYSYKPCSYCNEYTKNLNEEITLCVKCRHIEIWDKAGIGEFLQQLTNKFGDKKVDVPFEDFCKELRKDKITPCPIWFDKDLREIFKDYGKKVRFKKNEGGIYLNIFD